MAFASSSSQQQQLSLKKSPLLFVGEKAHLLCSYEEPIIGCKFIIPGVAYEIQLSSQSPPFITNSGFKFSYYGEGLNNGDCGVTIHNLTFVNQGHATCILSPQSNEDKNDEEIVETVEIRINQQQGSLSLLLPKITILNNDNSLKVGQTLAAECIAEDEFANLSWHLNNEILTNTTQQTLKLRRSDDSVTTSDEENYFYKIKSILMHELRDGDNGTTLKCRLDSFLTNGTSETELQLIVHNETRTLSLPKIGGAYDIAINFFAFPRPLSQKWKVNDRNIYYGKISDEFISRELKYLGNNQWRALLHITNITEKHFHFNYTLLVNDANGRKSYNVRLDDLVNQQHESNVLLNYNNSIIDGGVDEELTTVKLIDLDRGRNLILSNTQATKALLNLKSSTYRRRTSGGSTTKMPSSTAAAASEISRNNGSNRTKIIRKSRYNTTAIAITTKSATTTHETITTAMPTKATFRNDDVINVNKTGIIAAINNDNNDDAAPSFKIDSNEKNLRKKDMMETIGGGGRVHFSLEKVHSLMIAIGFIVMAILLLIFLSMICHYRRQVVILKTEIIQMNLESYYNQSCLYPSTYNNYSSSTISFQRNPLISVDDDVKTSIEVAVSEYNENSEASNSHLYQSIDPVYDEITSPKNCENNNEEDEGKPNNYENNESMNCKHFSLIFSFFILFIKSIFTSCSSHREARTKSTTYSLPILDDNS